MSAPRLTRLAASLCLACACSCSARDACNADPAGSVLESPIVTREVALTRAGEVERARFRGTLTALPRLWQSTSAIVWSNVSLTLRLAYADRVADGTIEMPRLTVAAMGPMGERLFGPSDTSLYPTADGVVFNLAGFGDCEDPNLTNCCEYGARECVMEWDIALERRDGEPYPPLDVSWQVQARTAVSSCPLEDTSPELVFEELAP